MVGVAKTCAEANALAKLAPLSLILSDIRIAGGNSGIAAVEALLEEHDVAVIFIPACPWLLPQSLRESAFVLNKPYREETVKVTIEQAVSRQCDCSKLLPCAYASLQPPL